MATEKCLTAIAYREEPYNRLCDYNERYSPESRTNDYCRRVLDSTMANCGEHNKPMDTPVDKTNPDFYGKGVEGDCSCCCSCFTFDTPIEVSEDKYEMIQVLETGNTIRAAGKELKWEQRKIEQVSGDIDESVIPNIYLIRFKMDEGESRELLVTADHLFLLASGELCPSQNLYPTDKLMRYDGKSADVEFVIVGEHSTRIYSLETEGPVDPISWDGHLLNCNGVVTGDYALQVAYETGALSRDSIVQEERYEVGTSEYESLVGSVSNEELHDLGELPVGFNPGRQPMVKIPSHARTFLTPEQETDVADNAIFQPYTSYSPLFQLLRLFRVARAYHPDVIYIVDWHNAAPNAYSWVYASQKFVVIAGGLARVIGLHRQAFALVTGVMRIQLDGRHCIGEADHSATSTELPLVWPEIDKKNSVEQIETRLFNNVTATNAKGDDEDPCANPSLQCRLASFNAGRYGTKVPECAHSNDQSFVLGKVFFEASSLDQLVLVFSSSVEAGSAATIENYKVHPGIEIESAAVESDDCRVRLNLTGAQEEHVYMIVVKNLISKDGQPLDIDSSAHIVRS